MGFLPAKHKVLNHYNALHGITHCVVAQEAKAINNMNACLLDDGRKWKGNIVANGIRTRMMRQAALTTNQFIISQWSFITGPRRQQLVPCGSTCLFKALFF
jgi:hypothetical protein